MPARSKAVGESDPYASVRALPKRGETLELLLLLFGRVRERDRDRERERERADGESPCRLRERLFCVRRSVDKLNELRERGDLVDEDKDDDDRRSLLLCDARLRGDNINPGC